MWQWDTQFLLIAGALAAGLAGLLLFGVWTAQAWRQFQHKQRLGKALSQRRAPGDEEAAAAASTAGASRQMVKHLQTQAGEMAQRWLKGRLGEVLLAKEDRVLIANCGFLHQRTARAYFVLARVGLCIGLAVLFSLLPWTKRLNEMLPLLSIFFGFALGWMLPKWWLLRYAAKRRRQVVEELPLFVDLMRLLQGVGLSLDQTLHTIEREFRDALPILAAEVGLSVAQFTRGRTREQSLERLAHGFDNEDLVAICRLIIQVDQHGGAMQEPLHRFGQRLREQRRLQLKERVGRLTVKMTGVMVLTLMPALLIITAGSGFLAIFRGLGRVAGG